MDYVSHLHGRLEYAEKLTRDGELGRAMWAYLEVLEVDPDNAEARKQIGQIVTAVRQFDKVIPGRRWANGLPLVPDAGPRPWWHWAIIATAILAAFGIGFLVASVEFEWPELPAIPPALNQEDKGGAGLGKLH